MTWRIRSCLTSCWVSLRAGLRAAPVRGGSPPLPAAGPEHPRPRGSSLRHRRAGTLQHLCPGAGSLRCSIAAPVPVHPAAASQHWLQHQAGCCGDAAGLGCSVHPRVVICRACLQLGARSLTACAGRRPTVCFQRGWVEVRVSALSAPEHGHLSCSLVEKYFGAQHFPSHLCMPSPVLLPPRFRLWPAHMVQVVPARPSQASVLHPLHEAHLPKSGGPLQISSTKKANDLLLCSCWDQSKASATCAQGFASLHTTWNKPPRFLIFSDICAEYQFPTTTHP